MRRFFRMMMAAVVAFGLTACGGGDDSHWTPEPPEPTPEPTPTPNDKPDDEEEVLTLVGQWYQINDMGTVVTLTFKADNSGTILYHSPLGTTDTTENFTYSYIEKEHKLTVVGSKLNGLWRATIFGGSLTIENDALKYVFLHK